MKTERPRLTVLVLPKHLYAVNALARERGETVAAVIRELIREEAQKRGLWTGTDTREPR